MENVILDESCLTAASKNYARLQSKDLKPTIGAHGLEVCLK